MGERGRPGDYLSNRRQLRNREEDATEQEQRGDDEPADGGKAFVLALGGGESEDRRAERKPIEDDDRDHEQRHQRVHRAEENHDKEKRESGRRHPEHGPATLPTRDVPDGER